MDDDSTVPTSERLTPLNFSNSKEFSNHVEISSKGYCRLFKCRFNYEVQHHDAKIAKIFF